MKWGIPRNRESRQHSLKIMPRGRKQKNRKLKLTLLVFWAWWLGSLRDRKPSD